MKDKVDSNVFFSIIMPCYNVAEYLPDSVWDITKQDFTDWELLLVDDASTDRTREAAEKLAKADERITVINSKKNKGVSAARNKGLKKACGKYILFLDPDDRYEHSMLDIYHDTIRETDADIVVCGLIEEYEKKGKECYSISHSLPYRDAVGAADIARVGFSLEKETMYGYPWNKAYKRSLLIAKDITFPKYNHDEDILFNIEAFMAAERVTVIPEKLYHYKNRIKEGNRLTDRYVPDYFPGKKRRIVSLYRQFLSSEKHFDREESKAFKAILAAIYFRSFASAIERMLHAGISIKSIRKFVKRQMNSRMFRFMKKHFHANPVLKILYFPLLNKMGCVSIAEFMAVSLVKRHFGQIFARIKQNR